MKKRMSEPDSEEPSQGGLTYGINPLNLGKPAHELDSDSGWLLEQCRKVQTENRKDRNNSTKCEGNLLSYF